MRVRQQDHRGGGSLALARAMVSGAEKAFDNSGLYRVRKVKVGEADLGGDRDLEDDLRAEERWLVVKDMLLCLFSAGDYFCRGNTSRILRRAPRTFKCKFNPFTGLTLMCWHAA